jgi:hypothetical protein
MPQAERGPDKLTEGDMDYILSILRHQITKRNKDDRSISEDNLYEAVSLVRKNPDQARTLAK